MTDTERLAALWALVNLDRHEDFDGPCWCFKRNAGPYEASGHSQKCQGLKQLEASAAQKRCIHCGESFTGDELLCPPCYGIASELGALRAR